MIVYFLTIVKNGMPFITQHLNTFNRLPFEWRWIIVEGTSAPVKDTAWCKPMPRVHSTDGTLDYLESISAHSRVYVTKQKCWTGGKVEMCNAGLKFAHRPGLLWQIDVDEFYTPSQIEQMYIAMRDNPHRHWAMFYCRYFLGPQIYITTCNTYGNKPGEWLRLWRFQPGMEFITHEPPDLRDCSTKNLKGFTREETQAMGVVFDHLAYATIEQVQYKEAFYGYHHAAEQWKKLQKNTVWPTRVGNYLKWVKDDAYCQSLYHESKTT